MEGSPAALINVVRDTQASRREEDHKLSIGTRMLRRILLRQSYARAWEAGWEAAFAASLRASMSQNRPGDAKAAKRTWAKLRDKSANRHDAARRAAVRAAQRMLDATPDGDRTLGQGGAGDVDPTAEIHAAGGSEVATGAWNFSISAIITAVDVLETPVTEVERSPSRPLLELYRMGLWPIGEVDGRFFLVYSPTPALRQR